MIRVEPILVFMLCMSLSTPCTAQDEPVRARPLDWKYIGPGGAAITAIATGQGENLLIGTTAGLHLSRGRGRNEPVDGFGEAEILAIAPDPRRAGRYLVSASSSDIRILASEDGGRTWNPSFQGFEGFGADPIVFDPAADGVVYARAGGRHERDNPTTVYRSSDRGATWEPVFSHLDIRALDLAVTTTGKLIVASDRGLWSSVDRGQTWSTANGGDAAQDKKFKFLAVEASASDALRVYAMTRHALYRSDNEGETWIAVQGAGLPESFAGGGLLEHPQALRVDPATPDQIFLASLAGVHRSTDGGRNWAQMAVAGLTDVLCLALAGGSSRGPMLYAGTRDGRLFVSTGAAGWRQVLDGLGRRNVLAVHAVKDGQSTRLLAAVHTDGIVGHQGLWAHEDGSWRRLDAIPVEPVHYRVLRYERFAVDPFDPRRIAVIPNCGSTYPPLERDAGIFLSTDAGRTWRLSGREIYGKGLTFSAVHPGRMYAVNYVMGMQFGSLEDHEAVWGTTGPGGEWTVVTRDLDGLSRFASTKMTSVADGDTEVLLLTAAPHAQVSRPTDRAGIYRSIDSGHSWTIVHSDAWYQLHSLSDRPGHVLGIGRDKILRSRDAGRSWVESSIPLFTDSGPAFVRGEFILVPTRSGLFATRDGGANWENLTAGQSIAESLTSVSAATAPGDRGWDVYVGTIGGGVWTARIGP